MFVPYSLQSQIIPMLFYLVAVEEALQKAKLDLPCLAITILSQYKSIQFHIAKSWLSIQVATLG